MTLLAAKNYDPATVATKSCSSYLPMTALDTTNLRLTFAAPDSGNVLVRLAGTQYGSSGTGGIFLGVLEGATVRARISATGTGPYYTSPSAHVRLEAVFAITGLTPQANYTWDAAYGVEVPSSNVLGFGGPNDSTGPNAYGAFTFEVWTA